MPVCSYLLLFDPMLKDGVTDETVSSHCRLFHRWLSSDSRRIQGREKLSHHVRRFPGGDRGGWNWLPENDGRQYKARGESVLTRPPFPRKSSPD